MPTLPDREVLEAGINIDKIKRKENSKPVTRPYLRHEGVWWSGGIGPLILVLDTKWSGG